MTHYKLVKSVKNVVKPAARPNEAPRHAVSVNYLLTTQQTGGEAVVVHELGNPLNAVEEAIGYLTRGDTLTDHNSVDWQVNMDYTVVRTFVKKEPVGQSAGPIRRHRVVAGEPTITGFTLAVMSLQGIECWRHRNLRRGVCKPRHS